MAHIEFLNEQREILLEISSKSEPPIGIKKLKTLETSLERVLYHFSLLFYISSPQERKYIDASREKLEHLSS